MAVFDANLMLRNTTQTVSSLIGGPAGLTGSWLTLGTGRGPADGITFRAVIQTSAVADASNTASMNIIYEFSDDQSVIPETVTQLVTGTQAGGTNGAGAVNTSTGDVLTRISNKRTYVRARLTTPFFSDFGVVTIGVDGGDFNVLR